MINNEDYLIFVIISLILELPWHVRHVPMTQYSSVRLLSTSYRNMRCRVETTFC